jgi:hypothetical protein
MTMGPEPRKRWDTASSALYGALLGICAAIAEQFCHAFCPSTWRQAPQGDLFTHVVIEVAVFAAAGAALLGAICAIRNWLVRGERV